jgi:hypothetical protein
VRLFRSTMLGEMKRGSGSPNITSRFPVLFFGSMYFTQAGAVLKLR